MEDINWTMNQLEKMDESCLWKLLYKCFQHLENSQHFDSVIITIKATFSVLAKIVTGEIECYEFAKNHQKTITYLINLNDEEMNDSIISIVRPFPELLDDKGRELIIQKLLRNMKMSDQLTLLEQNLETLEKSDDSNRLLSTTINLFMMISDNKGSENDASRLESIRRRINQFLRHGNHNNLLQEILTTNFNIVDFDIRVKLFRESLRYVRKTPIPFMRVFKLNYQPYHLRKRFTYQHTDEENDRLVLEDWFTYLMDVIFKPEYGLFILSDNDNDYSINSTSNVGMDRFEFAGRLIGKALLENIHIAHRLSESFCKWILEFPDFQNMLSNPTELLQKCQTLLSARNVVLPSIGGITSGNLISRITSFLSGFHQIIPKSALLYFNEKELQILFTGRQVDIETLKDNSEYLSCWKNELHLQWFWRAFSSFSNSERLRFLVFVTGGVQTPKLTIYKPIDMDNQDPVIRNMNQLFLPQYDCFQMMRDKLVETIQKNTVEFQF